MTNELYQGYDEVIAALRAGQAAIFPTDTVYGIGMAVNYAHSLQSIYDLKQRDAHKAIPWLVSGVDDLMRYAKDPYPWVRALAEQFWPGALTLIVQASSYCPSGFCADQGSIALRCPDDKCACSLISELRSPLATSSANYQGEAPCELFSQLDKGLLAQVAACGDAVRRSGVSSTIIDCQEDSPRLIRQGDISFQDICRFLQDYTNTKKSE